jgi:hypothetical protein
MERAKKVRADAIGCRPLAVSDAEMEIFIDTWKVAPKHIICIQMLTKPLPRV